MSKFWMLSTNNLLMVIHRPSPTNNYKKTQVLTNSNPIQPSIYTTNLRAQRHHLSNKQALTICNHYQLYLNRSPAQLHSIQTSPQQTRPKISHSNKSMKVIKLVLRMLPLITLRLLVKFQAQIILCLQHRSNHQVSLT